ncbi:hypothetical protein PFMALIP_00621 [Plasmodium falciparum MaliPS096_E11]|uniref:Uncharacterized protein n=1 Tax=Plasmodium falciparum MaliPS096_E11 TaxID=1036727 RepID=A0A024WXU5_PLAFA|nr:hypothetical protein PFMALIP_00621 [Plasmodium falciparum MaliPS096_E11]
MSRRRDHKFIFYKNCFYFFQITPQIIYIYIYLIYLHQLLMIFIKLMMKHII